MFFFNNKTSAPLTTSSILMAQLPDHGHRPAQRAHLQRTLGGEHAQIRRPIADEMGTLDAVLHQLTAHGRLAAAHLLALCVEATLGAYQVG